MSSQPTQAEFNECLAAMLREANAQGRARASIVSGDLHRYAGAKQRMPQACLAMFRLVLHQGGKAKLVGPLPNGATSTIEIEFDTADLP